jgi:ubiquinone/menaquinone biosynthesis C-methylase UbiE
LIEYDAELQLHNEQLRAACDIGATDSVLDIGCGTGQTTREAARIASKGRALGVDVDEAAIALARALADLESLPNARFEVGDAEIYPFEPAGSTSLSAASAPCSSKIRALHFATLRGRCGPTRASC